MSQARPSRQQTGQRAPLLTVFAALGFACGTASVWLEILEVKHIASNVRLYQPVREERPRVIYGGNASSTPQREPDVSDEVVRALLDGLQVAVQTSARATMAQVLAVAAAVFGLAATLIAVWGVSCSPNSLARGGRWSLAATVGARDGPRARLRPTGQTWRPHCGRRRRGP